MNDRFKFRVWDKENKTYYCLPYGSNALTENGELFWKCGDVDCSELDEEDYIVEQCTGLKDKNGNLIFEGDILNSLYRKDGCAGLYVVEWFDGNLGVKKVGEHQQKMVSVSLSNLTRCEVIGNIHKNEELLK